MLQHGRFGRARRRKKSGGKRRLTIAYAVVLAVKGLRLISRTPVRKAARVLESSTRLTPCFLRCFSAALSGERYDGPCRALSPHLHGWLQNLDAVIPLKAAGIQGFRAGAAVRVARLRFPSGRTIRTDRNPVNLAG
jgi:hypothetical protein